MRTTSLQVNISNKQILQIALPISMAMIVPQINFITNNVFLGQLGESELGIAGITGVFYMLVAVIGNGLNNGLQALISRRAGENRIEDIGKMFTQALWIALAFAFVSMALTFIIAPFFLKASLHSANVQQEAIGFLKIRVWGLPFLFLFQVGNAFLIGSNNGRLLKYGFFAEALINIVLDYALIFGHWGFPKLGFDGAAVASIIAEFAGVLIVFGLIFYKQLYHQFSLFKFPKFNYPLSSLIFRQSSPLILQWALSVVAWLTFYVLLEHYGERDLAISNTMRNFFSFFGIFIWAFASTTNSMVSNIIGQGKRKRVIFLVNKIMLLSLSFTLVLCLLINVFPEFFLNLYGRDDSFVQEAIPVVRMVSIGVIGMCIASVWLNSVTGTGNTKVNLWIEIIAISSYFIYIYFIMVYWKLSLVWAWSAEIIYWMIIFIASFVYIKSNRWISKIV